MFFSLRAQRLSRGSGGVHQLAPRSFTRAESPDRTEQHRRALPRRARRATPPSCSNWSSKKMAPCRSATVVEGAEPFAEQAQRAALTWRFAPARRGDTPVAARIRARVEFHASPKRPRADRQPRPVAAPRRAADARSPRPRPSPAGGHGASATGARSAKPRSPRATCARCRALSATRSAPSRRLPGVTPARQRAAVFLRARRAAEQHRLLRRRRFASRCCSTWASAQSVIHSGADRSRRLLSRRARRRATAASPAPSSPARRASPRPTLHGEANLRLVDAGALLEAPFADGRGSALVAGRYGYPGPILGAFAPDMKLGYWDYQARRPGGSADHDTLGVFAFRQPRLPRHQAVSRRRGSDASDRDGSSNSCPTFTGSTCATITR